MYSLVPRETVTRFEGCEPATTAPLSKVGWPLEGDLNTHPRLVETLDRRETG